VSAQRRSIISRHPRDRVSPSAGPMTAGTQ